MNVKRKVRLYREEHGYWSDYPGHDVGDWSSEIINADTREGYWDWVASGLQAIEDEKANEVRVEKYTMKGEDYIRVVPQYSKLTQTRLEELCGYKIQEGAAKLISQFGFLRVTKDDEGSWRI